MSMRFQRFKREKASKFDRSPLSSATVPVFQDCLPFSFTLSLPPIFSVFLYYMSPSSSLSVLVSSVFS